MAACSTEIQLPALFRGDPPWSLQSVAGAAGSRREEWSGAGAGARLDRFAGSAAVCAHLRLTGEEARRVSFTAPGAYRLKSCPSGGWLLEGENHEESYWIPQPALLRRVSPSGHILSERAAPVTRLQVSAASSSLELETEADLCLDTILWQIPPAERTLAGELACLAPIETQAIFLWGSHTTYRQPGDLYRHLIFGHVYENQYAWPHRRKICSENDAHALYVALNGLERATGKSLYALLKRQLLLSVLARQGADGGWRHGEWSDLMESHFRLHCSAIHMMLDALDEGCDPDIERALRAAVKFLADKTDDIDAGKWFLHDELELSEAGMKNAPFEWKSSRVLGKSPSNMLVLNTHLDALVALERYREVTGDPSHAAAVASGVRAARAVLELRPAEALYRWLFRAIDLTSLPVEKARRLPLPVRAVKRIAWRYLIPNLHRVKTRFPRLVMPGGYIDRALSLKSWAFHYLTINIMDLARFARKFSQNGAVRSVIGDAVEFTRRSGIMEKWAELDYERYALGFWCEALYQLAIGAADPKYREWLAEAVVLLERQRLGLPPSVLGANGEAVPRRWQVPTPLLACREVRVINLSRAGALEFMIVNASEEEIVWDGSGAPSSRGDLQWTDARGRPLAGPSCRLPSSGWIRGFSERDQHD
jgi:hypothetical protein